MEDKKWIAATGKVMVDKKNKRIVVQLGYEFCNYYLWMIENHFKQCFQIPRHSGHITIYLDTVHKDVDFALAKKFHGKTVNFKYSVHFEIGGKAKGFTNFWAKVISEDVEKIKKELKINDGPGYHGLHATICTTKSMFFRKFQKKMITVNA